MNNVSCAIWVSDSCIRFAIVPRIPLSFVTDVGVCIAGGSAGVSAGRCGCRWCTGAG